MSIGSIHGALNSLKYLGYDDLGVIWIDAHADLNTPLTSPTGNIHGQAVAYLLDELYKDDYMATPPEFKWMNDESSGTKRLKAKNLVYIGLRDLDPYEWYFWDLYIFSLSLFLLFFYQLSIFSLL